MQPVPAGIPGMHLPSSSIPLPPGESPGWGFRTAIPQTLEDGSATNDNSEGPIDNLEVCVGRSKSRHFFNIPLAASLLVPKGCPGMLCANQISIDV